ncbi:hemolysin family protein [Jatrophihabitans fulvus]
MTALLALLLGVVVVLAITAATGYFVAQEFAYMAVDRATLRAAAADGDATAQRTLQVTRRTSFMLSGAQLGITVTGLVVGYVAEPLIGESIGDLLGGVSVPTGVGIAIGTVIALLFSTFVQMIFGELFPKNLAIARPEPVARALSRSTVVYLAVTGWLISIFDASSNALLRLLRIEPVHDVEHAASTRDLERIVADSRETGDLPAPLSVLLDRVIDFPSEDVRHAMVPLSRADTVLGAATVDELRAIMHTGHSRYPVLDPRGRVLGVVHLVDVLGADDAATAADVARPACVVPESMPLPRALATLTGSREQMACVLDEYGGLAGVVTLEDLAEEVVGELTDEHDTEPPLLVRRDGTDHWTAPGDAHLDELERILGLHLPEGDYETVSGLAISAHGGFPAVGDTVAVPLPAEPDDLLLDDPPRRVLVVEVTEVGDHVPTRVRLRVDVSASTGSGATTDGDR